MKLLLDTHIWLWLAGDPARLKRSAVNALNDKSNELWLSPLSIWEVLLLAEKGKIPPAPTPEEWVTAALSNAPMKEAPLTSDVVMATKHVELAHRDPVDRFLAATARAFDLTLVTADQRLLAGRGFRVLANR